MNEIILLKLGELVLKGLNRRTFEDRLVANARRRLQAGAGHLHTIEEQRQTAQQGQNICDAHILFPSLAALQGPLQKNGTRRLLP